MTLGVLLMAYGTPESPDEVEPYYTHIRGGRTPSPEAVERLKKRYEIVGGRTPLLSITKGVRDALEESLNGSSVKSGYRVYAGMKHWHPFIGDVIREIARDGVSDLVAVALAPHYSQISIGGYRKSLDAALQKLERPMNVKFVDSWHLHPQFIELIAARVRDSLEEWPAGELRKVKVVFSAHSLPVRIRDWNDPYEAQLLASCSAVTELTGHDNWTFAWQSAGETGEPWLGPDIVEVLEDLHQQGVRDVLSVPIGFVSDHLEIQYDIDYEAARKSRDLGLNLRRTPMPNVDPAFVRLLASVVTGATG
jgi:protoporphyrin/coproporphyrin ferrochelatase